jgi:hypothetical protein
MKGWLAALAVCWVTAPAASGYEVYVNNGTQDNTIPWWPSRPGLRLQMLFDRDMINYAGTITEFKLEKANDHTATFGDVRFYLCHTPLAQLTTDFQANYGGNTPALVASFSQYTVPAVSGPYAIPMAGTFYYNNVQNLLLEITWVSGLAGNTCAIKHGFDIGYHRCLAWDPNAATGDATVVAYNAVIVFDVYNGALPSSWGRVKATFR